MRYIFRIFLSLFFLAAHTLVAQEKQIDLGEVIIEGKSIESSIRLRKESVSSKYIIPRADLVSFGYSTAGDVIKNLPLVYLDSEPGVNRNVSIGGLDREYQSILVNGKVLAGGEDSRDLKLDRIPISMIERIEIQYNSPVSTTSGGIAGTVNIILKERADEMGLNFHLQSNINTSSPLPGVKAEIEGSGRLGELNLYGGLSYNSYQSKKITELYDSSLDISGGIEELIVTDIFGANLAGSRALGKFADLKMKGLFSWFDEDEFEEADVKRRKDGSLNIRESDTENDKLRYLINYDLIYDYKKENRALTAILSISNNYEKRHKDQLQEKSDYFEEVREYEDQDNWSLDADIRWNSDSIQIASLTNSLNLGVRSSVNFRNTERINAYRPENYFLWDVIDESYNMSENIISLFGDLHSSLSSKLELLTAFNYEYSYGRYETTDTTGNHLFNHLSPSLNLKYLVHENLIINAGVGRHISRPAFMSMVPIEKIKLKKDLIEVGNPDLLPSKAIAIDLGASYYLNKSSYISAAVYYKWVRDMIEMRYIGIDESTSYNLYKYINVDTASLFGFYIDSRIDFNPEAYSGFTMYAAYSYMGSKTIDEYSGGTKSLDDQPAHLINFRFEYLNTENRFNLSCGINYNSERVISPFRSDEGEDIALTRESGYLNLAARAKYFFKQGGSIYLAGDNLLMHAVNVNQGSVNERYYPGAIIRLGLSFNISPSAY